MGQTNPANCILHQADVGRVVLGAIESMSSPSDNRIRCPPLPSEIGNPRKWPVSWQMTPMCPMLVLKFPDCRADVVIGYADAVAGESRRPRSSICGTRSSFCRGLRRRRFLPFRTVASGEK
jgi:hypothetical protein